MDEFSLGKYQWYVLAPVRAVPLKTVLVGLENNSELRGGGGS